MLKAIEDNAFMYCSLAKENSVISTIASYIGECAFDMYKGLKGRVVVIGQYILRWGKVI